MEKLAKLSIDELEKLKLKEEIQRLRKPFWKETSFISIIITIVIAFSGTVVTIWSAKNKKIEDLEEVRNDLVKDKINLVEEKKLVEKESDRVNRQYNEALAEKSFTISEKSEIQNKINVFEQQKLQDKRTLLRFDIQNLEKEKLLYQNLKINSKGYKQGFIDGYVNGEIVQKDIKKFFKEENMKEGQLWLKSLFLWTALVKYENYVIEEARKKAIK